MTTADRSAPNASAAALLEVHRRLELEEQLGLIAAHAVATTGAAAAFVLGPGGDRSMFVPLAASVPAEDARFRALNRVERARLERWTAGGSEVYDGFGPFAAAATAWPGAEPGRVLAVPLRHGGGRLAGVLLVVEPGDDADAPRRLDAFVAECSAALGNAIYVRNVRELVIKDDTAACFNRRYFEEFLPEELSRANRFRSPVSLIFLDMDNLKQVNNEYGHSMGSRTLYEVSVRVRSKIRKFDKLFRFGGDEFCIVLPETEWHGAMEVAERVRDAIAGGPFLERELGAGAGVFMTASLGIASFPLHARAQKDLIQSADRAMQKIKASGKNAIGVAEIGEVGDGS